jgi:peptidylprolyl isomerase
MPSRLLPLALIVLALSLAACGGNDNETSSASGTAPPPTATPTPEPTTQPSADPKDTKTKPVIAKPSGDPPAKLVIEDLVRGKGPAAKKGDTVSVQYVGASWSTGEEFDASWDRGQPFDFRLGGGEVIAGWDEGVAGMRKGGRRKLVIPPDMGYGPAGSPPVIAPDETLIFVVDLLDIS